MRTLLVLLAFGAATLASAQKPAPTPVKIKVRHGDPWAIAALLQGQPLSQPEISTVLGFMGVPTPPVTGVGSLIQNGRIIINPADNSIYFTPDN